ncbi:MAG TPA: transporter substrate-binding domain-containing protein [Burkholderiaceae bacterium]|nr:transporter substrate-binding domain-containing protein [Burkholderiaceae bacterium]
MKFAIPLLILFAAPALLCAAELKIGVETTDQYPIYSNVNGEYRGFARELLDDFAAKYQHTVHYVPLPIVQLHDALLTHHIGLKFPDNPKWQPERKKNANIAYSASVVSVAEGLSVPSQKMGRPLSTIKSIGAVRGFTPWPYMDAIKAKKITYREFGDFQSLIAAEIKGRVDGMYANNVVANYYLIEILKQPNALVFDFALPNDRSDFYLSSIDHPEIIAQFDEYLIKYKNEISVMRSKYHISDSF